METRTILLAVVMAGFVAAFLAPMGTGSSSSAASPPGQHLEGTWFFNLTVKGMPPSTDLITFTRDGGLVESLNDPILKNSAGTAHGAWVRTGNREFAFTWMRFVFDFPPGPGEGKFTATVRVRGRLRLSETLDGLSGPFKFDVRDPTGKVVLSSGGTAKGVRVKAERFD